MAVCSCCRTLFSFFVIGTLFSQPIGTLFSFFTCLICSSLLSFQQSVLRFVSLLVHQHSILLSGSTFFLSQYALLIGFCSPLRQFVLQCVLIIGTSALCFAYFSVSAVRSRYGHYRQSVPHRQPFQSVSCRQPFSFIGCSYRQGVRYWYSLLLICSHVLKRYWYSFRFRRYVICYRQLCSCYL